MSREADQRTSGTLLRLEPGGVWLNPRQRHAGLHAPLHFDERKLHVHRIREFGVCGAQLPELGDFTKAGTRWPCGVFRHPRILTARPELEGTLPQFQARKRIRKMLDREPQHSERIKKFRYKADRWYDQESDRSNRPTRPAGA